MTEKPEKRTRLYDKICLDQDVQSLSACLWHGRRLAPSLDACSHAVSYVVDDSDTGLGRVGVRTGLDLKARQHAISWLSEDPSPGANIDYRGT